MERLPRSAPSR